MSDLVIDIHDGHLPFLRESFNSIIGVDTIASKFRSRIAREIGSAMHIDVLSRKGECLFNDVAEFLFYWIKADGGLTREWLQSDDGEWRVDSGAIFECELPDLIDGGIQFAAYGLELIDSEINACGSGPFEMLGRNDLCFNKAQVTQHRASCILMAYKCLTYAQRLSLGVTLTQSEEFKAKAIDFKVLGRLGGEKKNMLWKPYKVWAIEQYTTGSWRNANEAAKALAVDGIKKAKEMKLPIIPSNTATSFARWFRAHDKHLSS